jgi:hypothetical protein
MIAKMMKLFLSLKGTRNDLNATCKTVRVSSQQSILLRDTTRNIIQRKNISVSSVRSVSTLHSTWKSISIFILVQSLTNASSVDNRSVREANYQFIDEQVTVYNRELKLSNNKRLFLKCCKL